MRSAVSDVVLRKGRSLSDAQRALWASQRRNLNHPVQNMVEVATVPTGPGGPLDPHRLAGAFATVVDAVDILRSRIVTDHGESRVLVGPPDGSALTTHVPLERSHLDQWVTERSARPIDMAVRAYDSVILSHEDGSVSWYLGLHHTVTDATSSTLIFRETAAVYDGGDATGSSYYRWAEQRSSLVDRRIERAASHWRSRSPAPSIGSLYAGEVSATPASHRLPVPVDAALLDGIEARLQSDLRMLSPDLGWSTLLLTVAAVLIHRVNGADRFAIGLPVHHRNEQNVREVIGPVMQVYPVDIEVAADDSFRTLFARVGRSVLATLRHTGPAGPPAASDFQAVVNLLPELEQPSFDGRLADVRWVHPGAADPGHLLRFQFTRFGASPELFVDVNEAAATPAQHERVISHLLQVLAAVATDPDLGIGTVVLPDDQERAALERWGTGSTGGESPAGTTVVDRLRAALDGSAHTAISDADGSQSLTGDQLWERVTAMAGWLQEQGVGPGVRVGIAKQRSIDTVVALFATIVAGGSFVPLDPAHPSERRQRLIERAGCLLVLDDAAPHTESSAQLERLGSPSADDEAYLLFTSGSTGEPKGVPITHQGLSDYLDFALDSYVQPGEPPVGALVSALTFDLTITSLFVPILSGGELVVVRPEGPAGLRSVALHDRIDWLKATPSHLEVLRRLLAERTTPHPLRTLVVGGEAFGSALAVSLAEVVPQARIFNEYGPTEAVVGCMIHQWTPTDVGVDVPIGRPAPGVRLRLLDGYGQPVPVGASGQLFIARRGLTDGYLGGHGDDAFVALDGTRFYRTGDLARLLDDDTLVYQGRVDEQLKVGGIRLDPTEVEHALLEHPSVSRAVVRMWEPARVAPAQHCVRCGLPDNVPGARFDDDGVCVHCHSYDAIKGQAEAWFRTTDDLIKLQKEARAARTGRYDAVHLLSGGKDSTYALYQLVDLGFDVLCLTLDNGFVSEGALENVRRSVADLGIDHEIMTSDVMNDIFRDSMDRHSNVCHGCYKTIYTLATERAAAEGAPLIFTGLSRGQLFETRLIPEQFTEGRFDPDAIDEATLQARRVYHRLDDGPNRLLDTSVFEVDADGGDVFDRISYVDFYRYVDVELAEMFDFLENRAPWVRPSDTGRSTNCLVNAAGIYTHLAEQGFHNYAEPYAWDVRLGHKTRTEALEELDDQLDVVEVGEMLDIIGYTPTPRQVLTAWFESADEVDANRLRTFLAERLPAHAVPTAFVAVSDIPLSTNGKVDTTRLPAPSRMHRAGPSLYVSAQTVTESAVVLEWEAQLGVEPIGVDDDFFALGGDSLAALKMVVGLSARLNRTVREELAFTAPTPRLLAAAIDSAGETAVAAPQRREGPPAFSSGERALLFEHLAQPENPRYNVARRYLIDGSVEVDRFVSALSRVVDRHGPLHWTYGEVRRHLTAGEAVDVVVGDDSASAAGFELASTRLHRLPFDLENGPLVRCLLQPLDDGSTGIALVFHHVSVDAGTLDDLWAEVDTLYAGGSLAELPVSYGDHTHWQEQRWSEPSAAAEFWARSDVARPTGVVRFPTDDGGDDGYVQRTASFDLDQLRAASFTTPFATVLAALAATIRPFADRDQLGIAITASTRDHPEAEGLVGYYLNTLPLVIDAAEGDTLRQLSTRSADMVAAALPHRTYPFGRIAADRRTQDLAEPNVEIMLAFEELAPAKLGGLPAAHEVLASGSAVTGATFFVQGRGRRVSVGLEYSGELMGAATASDLLDRFEQNLMLAIDTPEAALQLVDPAAAQQLNRLAAGPAVAPAAHLSLQAPFEKFALSQPDHPAIIQGGALLSYGELERRANLVAADLVADGVRPGDRVGISATRSPDAVVAILAVLKSGAAYVPIDPDYPEQRRRLIADEAGLGSRLIDGSLGANLVDQPDPGRPDVAADPERPAYLIFTSGSTGRPKGVVIRHRNIVESTAVRSQVYPHQVERFLLLSSFAFDSSMVGLFWSLFSGGTIVLPDADRHTDTLHLARLVQEQAITHLLALPSLYRLLLDEGPDRLSSLTTAIVAGEACPPSLAAEHDAAVPQAQLWNEYGPTEGTVWSHAYQVRRSEDGAVPIGRPIPNVSGHVLDDNLRPVPLGQPGELVLGGAGVAAGYLDRADLTAESFVTLPDGDGSVFYRTGDLVRWQDDGDLAFLGRIDHQVKIRGHRIETGEIEASALSVQGVQQAVADAVVAPAGTSQLALWLVADAGVDRVTVLDHLSSRLPEVMVPTHVVMLDDLPLSANGKVDRAALPDPWDVGATGSPDAVAAVGDLERRLALVWSEVLGVDSVGRTDNFFALGGDSIMSIQIVSRLRRRGWSVSTRDVFDYPTIAELAPRAAPVGSGSAEQGVLEGPMPLLGLPRWFMGQDVANPRHFTQSRWLGLADDVDVAVLLAAAQLLPVQHDMLRSRLSELGPESDSLHLVSDNSLDIEVHPQADGPARRGESIRAESSIDPMAGPTMTVRVFPAHRDQPFEVFVAVHHLVMDAVSWTPLLEDWDDAYQQVAKGATPVLTPKTTSVRQWAAALEALERHSPRRPVAGGPTSAWHLRRDLPESETLSRTHTLSRHLTAGLLAGPSVEASLVTAVATAVQTVTGRPVPSITIEGHGRHESIGDDLDLSRTVGWFTTHNHRVVTIGADPAETVRELAALDSEDALLAEVIDPPAQLPILINYLGRQETGSTTTSSIFTTTGPLLGGSDPDNHRLHALGVMASIDDGELRVAWDHHPEQISSADLERLMAEAQSVLEHLGADPGAGSVALDLVDFDTDELDALGDLLDDLDS